MSRVLLEVENIQVAFENKKSKTTIVAGLSFSVDKGETLCIVGESGCGKSLTSLSIMGLLPKGGKIDSGQIRFKDEVISTKTQKQLSKIRGNQISMIFQEPMTSLNPVLTVGRQISETIMLHKKLGKREARVKAVEMLRLVGISSPEKRIDTYPHELSGGMRQRVMIAIALSCSPDLLIADEPTTALDVTIQAQILELMKKLQLEMDMGIILITHDLAVVSEVADKILVMYAGKMVEYTSREKLFANPLHPYTQGLLDCIPTLADDDKEELFVIKGSVPSPEQMPIGCRFADRCPIARDLCVASNPPIVNIDNHEVACWSYTDQWDNQEGGLIDAGHEERSAAAVST
ncbi:ABC transporter ATP-binding protein [Sporosarcina sp. FA9]|uniref:ABC transporter ATP-binding protein n=1 Tax=Sporosarcina sp. FA9 TaxID=3413030 RepID=UPI003F6568E0